MKTRLSESQAEVEELLPITKRENVHFDWSILPLLLLTMSILFSLDHKQRSHKQSRKKMEHSDSFHSNSVVLMTLLMTPTSDFHWVISALTTLLTTPSQVKTRLKFHYDKRNKFL